MARHSLQRVDRILNGSQDGPVGGVVSVLRPAEIANYGAVGSTPTVLASILAGGALGALALTLVSSVRRRRRELALLKALGLTGRQLPASVLWQSSASVAVGVAIGMPIGIALGRWLWMLFAEGISAVPDPTVPALSMVLIALGALCFANVVAALPDASRPARQRRSCCTRSNQAFHPPEPTGLNLLHPRPGDAYGNEDEKWPKPGLTVHYVREMGIA